MAIRPDLSINHPTRAARQSSIGEPENWRPSVAPWEGSAGPWPKAGEPRQKSRDGLSTLRRRMWFGDRGSAHFFGILAVSVFGPKVKGHAMWRSTDIDEFAFMCFRCSWVSIELTPSRRFYPVGFPGRLPTTSLSIRSRACIGAPRESRPACTPRIPCRSRPHRVPRSAPTAPAPRTIRGGGAPFTDFQILRRFAIERPSVAARLPPTWREIARSSAVGSSERASALAQPRRNHRLPRPGVRKTT
jgi:hypothetical protein